jgi:ribosome biogenesis protein Nip4
VWTDDSTEELTKALNSWEFYISSAGKMSFSFSDDVIDIVLDSMTKK